MSKSCTARNVQGTHDDGEKCTVGQEVVPLMGFLSHIIILHVLCSKTYILFLSKHVQQLFFLKIVVSPLSVHF